MAKGKGREEEKGKNPYMEMFAAWEKMMSENMDTILRNPAFLASMGKALEHSLTFKEHLDKAIYTALRAMHLPSTQETDRILEEIAALRGEVAGLRAQVERLTKHRDRKR